MELFLCLLVLLLTSCASAVVTFLKPAAGHQVQGGTSFTVQWILEDGTVSASDLKTYQLVLCAGGNNASSYAQLTTLVHSAAFANDTQLSENIETSLGGSDVNAYFFMLVTNTTNGGTITSFSSRFTLSYMSGTFAPSVLVGIQTISGTNGPSEILNLKEGSATTAVASATASTSGTPTLSNSPTTPEDTPGLSTSAKIGLGVGIPLGVIGVALGGWFLFYYRKKREASRPWHPMGSELDVTPRRVELDARPKEAELQTPSNIWELPAKELAVELPG